MKTLVTGGGGFIGRWVVGRLLDEGHEVVALDDLSNGRRENLSDFESRPNFRGLIEGDLKDRSLLKGLFSENTWDFVFHLGASIHVQRSIDDPETTFRNDVDGTFAILEACREQYFRLNGLEVGKEFLLDEVLDKMVDRRPRLTVMSTCMVYAPASGNESIAEGHALRPASPYAASKIAADNLSLSYFHAYRMPVTVVRPFNTYGPFQKSNTEGGVVSIFLKRDIEGEALMVKGDGKQTRDLLYVEDCAEFVTRAGASEGAEGEVINAGTGHDIAVRDLAQMITTGENHIEHVPHDHPQAEIMKLLCDPSKARRLLEWEPRTSLSEGLERTRQWLRDNRWAW